ncbi:MAG: hypothetical protein IV100_32740 [Myxococcales bacterium]|nr:hypothetical protein [Myxococcales bacterium]
MRSDSNARGPWRLALLSIWASACAGVRTEDLAPQDPPPTRTYSGALLAYLTPSGFARYDGLGSRFAASAFPDDVPLAIPVSVVASDTPGPPLTIGGSGAVWKVRVQSITLELTPTSGASQDDGLAARVEISLYGDPLPVTGELQDCRVMPGAGARTLRIPLQVGRDVLGRIQVSVAPTGASVIPGASPPLDLSLVDCGSLAPGDALDALLGPFLGALLSQKAFSQPLARMVAALALARTPSRSTATFPEGGEVSVTLLSDINSADPPVLVSGTALLALPFSVGVSAVASPCSGVPATLPAPITSPAPEGLTWAGADLVMTVRQDALDAVVAAALSAGSLCGVAPMPIGTLADVLPLAGEAALYGPESALPGHTPVVARLSWLAAPTLQLTESGEGVSLTLTSTAALVETFVRVGTADHLLTRHSGPLAVSGLTPELRSDGIIGLNVPTGAQTTFVGPAALAARVVAQLADRLALFPVPERLPFPLASATFSIAGQHLVVHAVFDLDGPSASAESGALTRDAGSGACTASRRPEASALWFWTFAAGLLVVLARRRRAAHSVATETKAGFNTRISSDGARDTRKPRFPPLR